MAPLQTQTKLRLVHRDSGAAARKRAEEKRNHNAEELAEVETHVSRALLLMRPTLRRAA